MSGIIVKDNTHLLMTFCKNTYIHVFLKKVNTYVKKDSTC